MLGYGYQWWLNLPIDTYVAIGYNGQQNNVVPEHNLVVVFTACYEQASFSTIQEDYIILAIGHQPYSGLRVPLTFEQIKISAIVLAGVVIAIPLSVESFFQLRNR